MIRRFVFSCCLLIAMAATYFIYHQGLAGGFALDDGTVIVNNSYMKLEALDAPALRQAAYSNSSGPLMRPISMVSFALNAYATGINPYYFKLTNVFIHLLNGTGIFVLTYLILGAYRKRFQPDFPARHISWISLAVASAWLLHPFNLTSVLYIVQRMTSLASFFMICGLILYVYGRSKMADGHKGWPYVLAGALVFTPLAILSKENGALLPLFMLTIEVTLFNFQTATIASRRYLIAFYIILVAVPAMAMLAYIIKSPAWLMIGFEKRDFNLWERVMTESRVLCFYIRQIMLPNTAQMGLFHDDIAVSRSLFQPVTTILSMIGIGAAFIFSFVIRKKLPLLSFGILFFFAGHVLESTIFPFELAYEHRNYLPMYGLLLATFFYALYPLYQVKNLRLRQCIAGLFVCLFAATAFVRATTWGDTLTFLSAEVEHHPQSARANSELADAYAKLDYHDPIQKDYLYFTAAQHYDNALQLDNENTHPLFGLIMLSARHDKPLQPEWVRELVSRLSNQRQPDFGYKLNNLIACQAQGACRLSRNELESIVKAPLHNPSVKGINLATAYTTLNLYLSNIANDDVAATDALYKAVHAAPDIMHFRFNLVNYLMIKNRFPEARNELAVIRKMDNSQLYAAKADDLDKILALQGK